MTAGRNAVERNSDGSYDAVDSGGFGKDYHGQDVFGERIGGGKTGHFGGFEEGHFGGLEEGPYGFGDDKYKGMNKAQYSAFLKKQAEYNSVAEGSGNESSFDGSDKSSEEETGSDMKDGNKGLNAESSEENNNVGSLDTSFQIGENEDEKEKSEFTDKTDPEKSKELDEDKEKNRQELERLRQNKESSKEKVDSTSKALEGFDKDAESLMADTNEMVEMLNSKNPFTMIANKVRPSVKEAAIDMIGKLSHAYGLDFDRAKLESDIKTNGPDAIKETMKSKINEARSKLVNRAKSAEDAYNSSVAAYDSYLKSSFTDKTKEEEAKPGTNMAKASVGKSDYLTKANKDSTKEVPKEAPSRNDYPNHIADTLKGATDLIADNTTAKALGIQSLEDFAKEKGVDPNKFSTMKAYRSYQNKQIIKALPNLMKKVGNFFTERVKDFFDPSQVPERIRNTLARYNAATLIGAAILSIKSGAGLQASIDQALTVVDPEDQPDVSDFLESVLNDEGTVADLSNAIDDALAPEQTSNTEELDESIVNIGRKDNTDYSDFNAGLGTSGTTSDADVKVFIARNVDADPVLRRMISKMGK